MLEVSELGCWVERSQSWGVGGGEILINLMIIEKDLLPAAGRKRVALVWNGRVLKSNPVAAIHTSMFATGETNNCRRNSGCVLKALGCN